MLPSLFSLTRPATPYQWLFAIYCYVMPIVLYATWAAVSLMDMFDSPRSARWGLAVLLIPLLGGATYLLTSAAGMTRRARYAIVFGGLVIWLIPLIYGLVQVSGPLGPKALN